MKLEQTWIEQLKMSGWIAEQAVATGQGVLTLKTQYVQSHGLFLDNNCFFCDYAHEHGGCISACPARLVKPDFHCCEEAYNYGAKPVEFFAELKRLNDVRS